MTVCQGPTFKSFAQRPTWITAPASRAVLRYHTVFRVTGCHFTRLTQDNVTPELSHDGSAGLSRHATFAVLFRLIYAVRLLDTAFWRSQSYSCTRSQLMA